MELFLAHYQVNLQLRLSSLEIALLDASGNLLSEESMVYLHRRMSNLKILFPTGPNVASLQSGALEEVTSIQSRR